MATRPDIWAGVGRPGLLSAVSRGLKITSPGLSSTRGREEAPGATTMDGGGGEGGSGSGGTSNSNTGPGAGAGAGEVSGLGPIHRALVHALSHSLGASAVHLNRRNVDAIRETALWELGLAPADTTRAQVLAALLQLQRNGDSDSGKHSDKDKSRNHVFSGREEGLASGSGSGAEAASAASAPAPSRTAPRASLAPPMLFVLDDDLQWLLHSEAASQVLLAELQDPLSRALFIAIPPEGRLQVGQYAPSARPSPPPAVSAGGAGGGAGNGMEAPEFEGSSDRSGGGFNPFASLTNLFSSMGSPNPPSSLSSLPPPSQLPQLPPALQQQLQISMIPFATSRSYQVVRRFLTV
jgi:hypothetical protein